jgi:glycerophosphoryl diester phosphodiesterase
VSARPLTVCHRGASALAAENTLDAFRIAMEYGIDFSELDVFVSRAGDLVVTHDPVVDAAAERALPRLSDVFEVVRGRMGIYVELKGEGSAAALGELLQTGAADDVRLISGSFALDLVATLAVAAPSVPRSILFTAEWRARPAELIAECRALGATYAHPCFRPIEPALVDAVHQAGLQIMTPHTNDVNESLYFAEIGVDVIASDDPRILALLALPNKPEA